MPKDPFLIAFVGLIDKKEVFLLLHWNSRKLVQWCNVYLQNIFQVKAGDQVVYNFDKKQEFGEEVMESDLFDINPDTILEKKNKSEGLFSSNYIIISWKKTECWLPVIALTYRVDR